MPEGGVEPLRLDARTVAAVVTGRLAAGDPARVFGGFSIDSRSLEADDLFFAIRGARFDGHEFVPVALVKGAAGVVVTFAAPGGPAALDAAAATGEPPVVIEVADTTRALQDLARYVRRESGATVVAITGSAGKTTTKEIAAELLSARYRVFRNKGNLNNHIGLPLSLLELRERPEFAVVELGMNHAGEISTLVSIAEPEVRVWTNVLDVHAEFFASTDAIADAKAEIMERASAASVLVANADDRRVMERARRFAGRVVSFGLEHAADVTARDVHDRGLEGVDATIVTPAGEAHVSTPLVGTANLANLLAAITVSVQFEIAMSEIERQVAGLRPPAHRGQVLRLRRSITVIDDSYNSNPTALGRAFEVLRSDRESRRKVAVVGEMLELGARSEALHAGCGRAAAEAGIGLLIAVGGRPAERLAETAREAGMPPDAVHYVATSAAAAALTMELLADGDLVLVKGSRGIRTDVVVERLQAELS